MATPITRAEVLNLIQSKASNNGAGLAKKGVCHKCNKPGHWSRECPENNKGKGRNGNGNERPKDVKSWKSTPPPSGAPQVKQANGKAFNWCASCKRWTTTHATATHTGVKKSSEGPQGVGSAINNVSLAFDPSVWTTEIEVVPSVTDALFILRTMVTRILPVLVLLLTYVMAIFSVPFAKTMWTSTLEIIQLAMAHFNAVDWSQVMAILRAHVMVVRPHVSQFLRLTRRRSLLHCFGPYWPWSYCSGFLSPAQHRLSLILRSYLLAAIVVLSSNTIARSHDARMFPAGSIRSHGLHRRYPINLRSMGRYIRRNAPTLVEQQQQVQLNDLHSKVATLLQRVDSLKRSIPRSTHWTCRHCNDTIVHGPTEPCPKLRNTSRSPSDLSTQEEGPRINHCDVNDAYLDAPLRQQRRRAAGFPSPTASIAPSLPLASKA
ncbi:hypothetical protein MHU86_5900 [Fragilaria crotonensis]|nr:hypothetical protein MHU86_5900 [Fragilaria crotonensis]